MSEEYENFYQTKLLEPLTELDEQRKNMIKNRIALVVLVALAILIHSVLIIFEVLKYPLTIFITVLVLPMIAYFVYQKFFYKFDEIAASLKDLLIKEILVATMNPNGYKEEAFIPYLDFQPSRLYNLQPDHYAGKHYMKGGKLSTVASYIESGIETNEGKWETVFEGYFMICEEKFLFQGTTIVVPDDTQQNLGILGQKLKETSFTEYKYVKMQNKDFNKTFAVYSNNLLDTYKNLNDKVINTLLDVQEELGINIGLTIMPNKIYTSIEFPSDYFEFNHWKTMLNPEKYAPLYEATSIAINQIKEIGLNSIKKELKILI